jgi:hypothetical protein
MFTLRKTGLAESFTQAFGGVADNILKRSLDCEDFSKILRTHEYMYGLCSCRYGNKR